MAIIKKPPNYKNGETYCAPCGLTMTGADSVKTRCCYCGKMLRRSAKRGKHKNRRYISLWWSD